MVAELLLPPQKYTFPEYPPFFFKIKDSQTNTFSSDLSQKSLQRILEENVTVKRKTFLGRVALTLLMVLLCASLADLFVDVFQVARCPGTLGIQKKMIFNCLSWFRRDQPAGYPLLPSSPPSPTKSLQVTCWPTAHPSLPSRWTWGPATSVLRPLVVCLAHNECEALQMSEHASWCTLRFRASQISLHKQMLKNLTGELPSLQGKENLPRVI